MNEKLNDALNEVKEEYIAEAAVYKRRRVPYWLGTVAAVLAVAILLTALGRGTSAPTPTDPALHNPATSVPTVPPTTTLPPATVPPTNPVTPTLPPVTLLANQLAAPAMPEMAAYPSFDDTHYGDAYDAWYTGQKAQYDQPEGYADSLENFFTKSLRQFLSGEGNRTYSPVNVYMALAMLAESAQGESRQQILNLLGAESIEALAEQAGHVWNAHYSSDGLTSLRLANSLWLDSGSSFPKAPWTHWRRITTPLPSTAIWAARK